MAQEDALRERYNALQQARRDADAAQMERLREEEKAIEEEKLAATQLLEDERAAQAALIAKMEADALEVKRQSATAQLEALRGQLDDEEAVLIEYRERMKQIENAYGLGIIQDAKARAELELAVAADRDARLAALRHDAEAERRREQVQMAVNAATAPESDPEIARIQAQIDFLQEARREGLEIEGSYAEALVALEKDKQGRIDAIQQEQADKEKARQLQIYNAAANLATATLGIFNQLANNRINAEQRALNATENATASEIASRERAAKAAFDNGKALQLAMVGVNTAAAIMNELATGLPGTKWLNVAAIAATGATQALAIGSAQFGGLSSGGSVTPPSQGQQAPQSETNFNNQITINVTGADGDIVEQLQDFFARGGVLFTDDTTQGRTIRG
jgi:hypothetical protein